MISILDQTTDYYNHLLNSQANLAATSYLKKRCISPKIANLFRIGCTCSPNNFSEKYYCDALTRKLSKDTDIHELVQQKVSKIIPLNGGFVVKDFYKYNTIIFPILEKEKTISFVGRSFDPKSRLKYKNFKVTNGIAIFNQDIIKYDHIDEIYITEGIIDALSLISSGFDTIATLGTQGINAKSQTLFLESLQKTYIFVYDNDDNQAGQNAVYRSASILKGLGINKIYQIILPKKEWMKKVDVNTLFCKTGDARNFRKRFNQLKRELIHVEPRITNHRNKIPETSSDIVQTISKYVELTKVNSTLYRGKCPFHDDTIPSFTVYPVTGTFKCYGCGEYGNSIQFISKTLGVSYKEAAEKLERNNS